MIELKFLKFHGEGILKDIQRESKKTTKGQEIP